MPSGLPHSYITRHELNGRLHFGHHALRFINAVQACLTEASLPGHGAHRVDLLLDITRNELAVSTHPSIQVDKAVGLADGSNALVASRVAP